MKPEINAAAEFLSRIFLAHDNISKEKVSEFKHHLSEVLEERFRDHWHETCPTKGQAYRCIRVCPEEPLDPVLEKVCTEVGINVGDFNLPFELTLWVDPTEVVCKFGDLKCSYHTVAKKDQTSGSLDNQAQHLDIDDLVENARDLYLKKQTVIIHPVHSTEMHIPNPYSDGSSNGFTMAIRINGTMHYNASGSPPPGYDGSPRSKGKPHSLHHKRGGGFHYYGKSSGGKGAYLSNGTINSGTHVTSAHHGYQHHRNHNHHHPHHHHHHGSNGQHGPSMSSAYSNGYLNGYGDENGYGYDQQTGSPTKLMGMSGLPPMNTTGGPGQISQSSPTPEQIQQQMQHPPPLPPHIHQAFGHPPADTTTLPPPPSTLPQQQSLSTTSAISTTSSSSNIISSGAGTLKPSSNGSNSKYQGNRGFFVLNSLIPSHSHISIIENLLKLYFFFF
ncbi:hypothetical protein Btru_021383 [Bulinus truncatus]|nr:hypothetical protein Btru_021383 [Bulinus truncatus]